MSKYDMYEDKINHLEVRISDFNNKNILDKPVHKVSSTNYINEFIECMNTKKESGKRFTSFLFAYDEDGCIDEILLYKDYEIYEGDTFGPGNILNRKKIEI